jgi:peptide/nickel transport system permease protein
MFPTMLGVAAIIFLLLRVIPGDVVQIKFMSGEGQGVSAEAMAAERAKLGLDKPVWKQFLIWLWGVMRLDLGMSMWTGAPITEEIKLRFALSLQLALMATIVATVLAIPLGILSALKQDTWVDYAVRVFSIAGLAIPSFWLGILMILGFLIFFKWLPPMVYTPFWVNPWQNLAQLIWPALAVGYRYSAVATRMTRSSMLEVLREDYIRTARAKGLWLKLILVRHALKKRHAARGRRHRARVRVPARRSRGDGAGVQPERSRPPVRAGDRPARLHADASSGAARGLGVHLHELPDGRDVRVARPEDPLPLGATMAITPPLDIADVVAVAPRSWWIQGALAFCRRRPVGALGAMVVVIMILVALTAPVIAPYDPLAVRFRRDAVAPSAAHWLGTDSFGRDVLSRLIYGSRTALIVGFGAAFVGATAGRSSVSAARTSRLDRSRAPALHGHLHLVPPDHPGAGHRRDPGEQPAESDRCHHHPDDPRCALVIRSSSLSIRELPYVDAARAAGFGHSRIIMRHMLRTSWRPI